MFENGVTVGGVCIDNRRLLYPTNIFSKEGRCYRIGRPSMLRLKGVINLFIVAPNNFSTGVFMRKNVLALSLAAMGLGFAGGAFAITDVPSGATAGSDLQLSKSGTGHMAVVPYFTTQNGNSTLLSIVNTDAVHGKAVKVRFRGAANSDDVFDFQVFLSPNDVWTANISKNADGLSYLTTTDTSCTKPAKAVLNSTPFITTRLDPNATADARAAGTREGYVEIFNMADITNTTAADLYDLIKHPANGAPKCADTATNTAWTAINKDKTVAEYADPAIGLTYPTTGLMANWTIINVPKALSWNGDAVAIEAHATGVVAGTFGNMVYFPQVNTAPAGVLADYTSDPLLVSTRVTAGQYDLPDMSTPYTKTATDARAQVQTLTKAIATTAVMNEYVTDSSISAATDWVFSMPTRRYAAAVDYTSVADATKPEAVYADAGANTPGAGVGNYFLPANTKLSGNQLCVTRITYALTTFDREENAPGSPDDVVVSPATPGTPAMFCGEASVISFNNGSTEQSGVLSASVALKDLDTPFVDGWAKLVTPSAAGSVGLPILGQSFVSAIHPSVAPGTSGNFGLSSGHRFVRP